MDAVAPIEALRCTKDSTPFTARVQNNSTQLKPLWRNSFRRRKQDELVNRTIIHSSLNVHNQTLDLSFLTTVAVEASCIILSFVLRTPTSAASSVIHFGARNSMIGVKIPTQPGNLFVFSRRSW